MSLGKKRIDWGYLSFSCMDEKELKSFFDELIPLVVMDFCPVPRMSIRLNGKSLTVIEDTLGAMHTEFTNLGILIVILPEDTRSYAKVMEVCSNLGVIYYCCSPRHARKPSKEYLKDNASEILKKIKKEIIQDRDEKEDEDSENDYYIGSDGETEDNSSVEDEETEDVVSEQLDYSDQQGIYDGSNEDLLEVGETEVYDAYDEEYSKIFDSDGYYTYDTAEKKKPGCDMGGGELGSTMSEVETGNMSLGKKRIDWGYVSFSCMDETELKSFFDELIPLVVMDFCPMSRISIRLNGKSLTVIEDTLGAMHTEFTNLGILIVILPEDTRSYAKAMEVCSNLGVIYYCCSPRHARKPSKEYLRDNASEILKKIKKEEIIQDKDDKEDEDSENDYYIGSDGETEDDRSVEDEETEDDVSEQLDSSDQQYDGCNEDLLEGWETEVDDGYDEDVRFRRGNVSSWACINFSGMDDKYTLKFLDKLKKACLDIGMGFYPLPVSLVHAKSALPTDIEDTVFGMHEEVSQFFADRGLGLLIVILPKEKESCSKVLEVCESLGVVYQCFSYRDARKPNKQYLQDTVAHHIEMKVLRRDAGRRQSIVHTAIPLLSKAPTFTFGGDIISYSTPQEGSISIASVVASMDCPGANNYKALVSYQPADEVIIKDLNCLLKELVCAFHKSIKKMPTRVIYFRHGVIEDQLKHTFVHEMDVIRMVCPQAKITFVVVAQRADSQGSGIEEGFGLTKFSSQVRRLNGSNMIVSYRVFHDDNHFTANELQSLCSDLLTRRIRWTYRDIFMAPPAYLAHLAALTAHKYVEGHRSDDASMTSGGTCQLPNVIF